MKLLNFILLFCSIVTFSDTTVFANGGMDKPHCATCVGSKNCSACKNCKYCKHCNSGGSCGVCSSASVKNTAGLKPLAKSSSVSSQCRGTTKKGARCKRMVKGGGYCWQHG